ncbi:hypothetical protein VaNZ11_016869, partial [Volvox africanus]
RSASGAEAPEYQAGAENPSLPEGEGAETAAAAAEVDVGAESTNPVDRVSAKIAGEKGLDRQIEILQSELQSTRQELESVRTGALGNQVSTDEVRETYRRKLQAMMRHMAALGLSMWEEGDGQGQEGADPRVTPEALFRALQSLADENVKVTEAREADLRHYADDAMARLVELRRKFKALYTAYRDLRYLVEDRWPGPDPPPKVPHEDEIVGGTLEGLIRSEEEADRRTINRLRDQVSQLHALLESMRLSRGVREAKPTDPGVSNTAPTQGSGTVTPWTSTEGLKDITTAPAGGGSEVAATRAARPPASADALSGPYRTGSARVATPADTSTAKAYQTGDATASVDTSRGWTNASSTSGVHMADDPRVSIAPSPPPIPAAAAVYPSGDTSRPLTPAAVLPTTPDTSNLAPSPPPARPQSPGPEAASLPRTRTTTRMMAAAPTTSPPRSPPAAPFSELDGSFPAPILLPPEVPEPVVGPPPPPPPVAPVALELQTLPLELPLPPPPPEVGSPEGTKAKLYGAVVDLDLDPGGVAEVVTRGTADGSSPVKQQPLQVQVPPPPPLPPAANAHLQPSQSPLALQQRLPSPLPSPAPPRAAPQQASGGSRVAPEPDPHVQVDNQRLREELGQLKKRLQAVSEFPAALEAENQRLRDEVDSLGRKLQMAASAASAGASKAASAVAMPPNTVNEGLIRQLREFNQKTTAELQRRAQQSETRAVMAEEQLEQLQGYMTKASATYQKEIVRLRSIIGQMETSIGAVKGSYLNLSPLEGVGGGGTLRPAAAVLEEIASRNGSLTRRTSAQGQMVATTTPRETRSGGGSRTPLISPGGGLLAAAAANAGGAAVRSKADDGVTHLPVL